MAQVEVLRIEEGRNVIVRILDRHCGTAHGLMTHYIKKDRSYLCLLDECPASRHAVAPNWKTYIPVLLRDDEHSIWLPRVLEVTEALEVTFRGEVTRGQSWRVWRRTSIFDPRRKRTKSFPVEGKQVESGQGQNWPEPFDVRPVVARLYRAMETEIVLNVPNPLPAALYVAEVPMTKEELTADLERIIADPRTSSIDGIKAQERLKQLGNKQ